ncbi:Hypothetical predicted protein [Pelobates cultripes]|uniref:Uncharacterized protein n=1 Tax=Pelobates cultripes TaxID=61616 RepID=A0AAD1TF48_PELCU|nr:Hypothetical predicted protein [Pelobates cultripes]
MTETPMSASEEKNQIVRERLSWFGLNPTVELIQQTMAQVDVEIREARAHEMNLNPPQQNPAAGMAVDPAERAGKPKIPHAAFR